MQDLASLVDIKKSLQDEPAGQVPSVRERGRGLEMHAVPQVPVHVRRV